jgi:hypothetical protein
MNCFGVKQNRTNLALFLSHLIFCFHLNYLQCIYFIDFWNKKIPAKTSYCTKTIWRCRISWLKETVSMIITRHIIRLHLKEYFVSKKINIVICNIVTTSFSFFRFWMLGCICCAMCWSVWKLFICLVSYFRFWFDQVHYLEV